jgi:hypothetical protein
MENYPKFRSRKICPLVAQSRRRLRHCKCPLSGGTADIGLPQTYRYRALSVAVLIVTLCKLGAVHMAVGVVLSAIFWVHIY